jgi:Putative death-receptor fusion protein (DUF2428)
MQRAVVGAWLLVKEATSMLAKLAVMAAHKGPKQVNEQSFMSLGLEDVNGLGMSLLDGLGRLKHMGAISESHSALQSLSSGLLQIGAKHPEFCRLPMAWLKAGLAKLDSQQQVFILRRSAGFAYGFLSLLRAEPGNCEPAMLPLAMETLFACASSIGDRDASQSTHEPRRNW